MFIDLTLSIAMDDPIVGKANVDQNSFMSQGHVGTHLDTYLQTAIPTEYCLRRGCLIDATAWGEGDIDEAVLESSGIAAGDFVILRTGTLEHRGYGTREYFKDHPQLSWTLIDRLIEAGVSFIGIDAAGVRRGDEHAVADRKCEQGGIYIIENLDRVEQLAGALGSRPFKVITGWTGLKGLSGLSCRVVAQIES